MRLDYFHSLIQRFFQVDHYQNLKKIFKLIFKSPISNGQYVPLAAWYELVSEWIPELASSSEDGLES